MSKLIDYLTVVKNGIKNGDKIIEALSVSALVKNGKISEEALAEILRRKDICAACPFNSNNAPSHGLPVLDVDFQHCTLCTCRLGGDDTKEYCLSCNCGIEVWNKRNPDKPPMPLKWSAFTVEDKP